jgi:FtsH-binding integral membrane protein
MTLPAVTPRGFWIRIVVFGGSLVVYLWGAMTISREHSLAGVALLSFLSFLTILSLTQLIVTVMRQPSRRPR